MSTPTTFPQLPLYFNQLSRARRFLDRIAKRDAPSHEAFLAGLDAYQDDMWSFFMNVWHVKDWIKNDDVVPQDVKRKVLDAAHSSATLMLCRGIANGVKHLLPGHAEGGKGAVATYILFRGDEDAVSFDYHIRRDDDSYVTVYEVACDAMREWKRILTAQSLPLPHGWRDP